MKINFLESLSPQRLFIILAVLMPFLLLTLGLSIVSASVPPEALTQPAQTQDPLMTTISITLAISIPAIAASYALAKSGSAAISSLVEKPEAFFKAFLVVTLCEAIAIYGLIIAILLWLKL